MRQRASGWTGWAAVAGLAWGLGACGGGDDATPPLDPDTTEAPADSLEPGPGEGDATAPELDAIDDAAPGEGDAEPDGEGGGGEGEPAEEQPEPGAWSPPPLAPEAALEPVAIDAWMVAILNDASVAQVQAAIAEGTFELPRQGPAYGSFWSREEPDESGAFFGPFGNVTVYGVTRLVLEEATRLVVRADGIWQLFSGDRLTAGDIYHSKRHRTPMVLDAGEHLLFFQSFRSTSPPQIELWRTPHELVFHPGDLTWPNLVEGDLLEQWIGVPVLNLSDRSALDVQASVQGAGIEPDTRTVAALPRHGVTQVAFPIRPTAALKAGDVVSVELRLASPSLEWSYAHTVELEVLPADTGQALRRTRLASSDASVQYYGLRRPPAGAPPGDKSLVLSLHGAGVEAVNQAASYSPKDWAYIVAPTNRRPFGFDWESFGRNDAIEALEHAKATLPIDLTSVHVTGHSMGGHGTWQMGTLFPGEFAVVGPSAGWESFYSYGGAPRPNPPFSWSQGSSDTLNFVSNLAQRAVYIIHGTADDNVPISEGETMYAALQEVTDDLYFHREEGAGHWWDGPNSDGVDCVDWPELFEWMSERWLDPAERDFTFTTPAPWVSRRHAWVSIRAADRPDAPSVVDAIEHEGGDVSVTTTNVRALEVNTAPLVEAGVSALEVDGESIPLDGQVHALGPQTGKRPGVEGPGTAVFYRPFCFVYPDRDPAYARWVAWLASVWNIIGNGRACALPSSRATAERIEGLNIIWLGVPASDLPVEIPASTTLDWDPQAVRIGGQAYPASALFAVFPVGDQLHAVWYATVGQEGLIGRIQPFTSRLVLPDFLVLQPGGFVRGGFFDADWAYEPTLSLP